MQIVALAFAHSHIDSYHELRFRLRCVLRMRNEDNTPRLILKKADEISEINYKPVKVGPRVIWRVKCSVSRDEHDGDLSSVRFALVDIEYMDFWLAHYKVTKVDDTLLYHAPRFVERFKPRRAHTGYCLDKASQMNAERYESLLSWLNSHSHVGHDRVRMCLFDWVSTCFAGTGIINTLCI